MKVVINSDNKVEKIIACCGLDCSKCDAHIATVTNDNELLIKTIEKWKAHYNIPDIAPEQLKCTGCREEGIKMIHCSQCGIRNCAAAKGLQTCAGCELLEKCNLIEKIHNYDPTALANLKSLN